MNSAKQFNFVKGRRSESMVVQYLIGLGWKILGTNVHIDRAELDIIAESEDHQIIFIEVKSNWDTVHGSPASRVNKKKQYQLWQAAWHWLLIHALENREVRFDIFAVQWKNGQAKLNHYISAFEGPRANI